MEKEFSKLTIVIAVVVGMIFIIMVALFIVATTTEKMAEPTGQNINQAGPMETEVKEKAIVSEDQMEFEDPGDDEIGQEIKQMDSLINETVPSELTGDDLSDEVIDANAELE